MRKMVVYPSKINGVVKISGSKNAGLPIIAASMVAANKVKLKNVSNISDINNLITILDKIGLNVKRRGNKLKIKGLCDDVKLHFEEVKKFRASYYLMSVFLALFNKVSIHMPGGCKIGSRPIDYHLKGFESAGCEVKEDGNIIEIFTKELKPFIYKLPKKSLGATVNLIILGSKIEGKSIIENASTEPEIDDLINFINKGYAKVFRHDNNIVIYGEYAFRKKIEHKIMPDRIEAFTYVCLGACSKSLKIKNINIEQLKTPLDIMKEANLNFKTKKNSLTVYNSKLNTIDVSSDHYPKLSTDQMPLLYPLFTRVLGCSTFKEGIFKERFMVCEELEKTGADISISDSIVKIVGKQNLRGAEFFPMDLRAAASLLIEASLNGNSTINNLEYLERGYDLIYKKLKRIGLKFKIENDKV